MRELFHLPAPVELIDKGAGCAPVLLDFDEKFKENAVPEECLDVFARRGPDLFEHGAALADQNGFLPGSLAENGGRDAGQRSPLTRCSLWLGLRLFPALHDNGSGVRHLFPGQQQHLFPDDFGREKSLRLVGDLVTRKKPAALRKTSDDGFEEQIEALPFTRRDGNHLTERVQRRPVRDDRQQILFWYRVDLVEHEDDGTGQCPHQGQREGVFSLAERAAAPLRCGISISGRQPMCRVYEEEHSIAALECVLDLIEHAAVELCRPFVNAGRVDEHNLRGRETGDTSLLAPARQFQHAEDPRTGGLRLVRNDGQLLPEQCVQQRRFPGVGPADDGHKSGAEGHAFLIVRVCVSRRAAAQERRCSRGYATLLGMKRLDCRFLVLLITLAAAFAATAMAQSAPPGFRSTEVHPDHSVTFHYIDGAAAAVELALEGTEPNLPMTKDESGIWTVTTKPLEPEIYGYHFEVDKQQRLDRYNTHVTTNLLNLSNMVEVKADTPEPWDTQDVPHGELHEHVYTTHAVVGLPENQANYFVYTPPGYDSKAAKAYPVLYLLHGWSDRASGWIAVGQAPKILDALLAQGKLKPMIVVMPLGYGEMSFVLGGHNVWNQPDAVNRNVDLFRQALLTEVLPQVETEYRVSKKREDRAIVGLSMGGLESLTIGLTNTDKFAYVGGFSSAVHGAGLQTAVAQLDPKRADLRVLWVACGTEDQLLQPNREFIGFLKDRKMPVTAIETPGRHTWMVWRDNLIHFAPLLFQGK